MSFTDEQKKEIVESTYKSSCCRKELLFGFLCAKASYENDLISVNCSPAYLDFLLKLIKEFSGRDAEVCPPQKGGRYRLITFKSSSVAKRLSELSSGISVLERCSTCQQAFLRGLFLSSASFTHPKKSYQLEILPAHNHRVINEYLNSIGVISVLTERRGIPVLYVKNSTEIEDFCALAGLNNAAFEVMNAKIEGEIRNNVNRVANCETNNIEKAVLASQKHVNIILELERLNLLSSLPEELEQTARMRVLHRDLSLSQLAQIMVPPVSKPGLSHRLSRITEIAEQLLKIKD